MATITLKPEVYDKATFFARKDKLNVEDWVNNIIQKIAMKSTTEGLTKDSTEQEMFSWSELEGFFSSDKSDKELRNEYLEEKYGV